MFKGKKMAGHMGAERVTVQNLPVVRTDADEGLIFVRGSVPGHDGGWVEISDAVKRAAPEDLPFPAAIRGGASAEAEEPAVEEPEAEAEVAEEAVAPAEEAAPADDAEEKKE